MATGGHEGATTEYGYGTSETVLTQAELRKGLASGDIDAGELENVVMIQCVGSRQKEGRPYCSRICCMGAIGNALKIKEQNPEARVFILYRDIMTYGFYEQYYTKARSAGIIFMNYSLDNKPQVEMVEGKSVVKFMDPVLQEEMELPADLVVLSTGVDPEESNQRLADAFRVSLTEDGFLAEADSKWRPDRISEGWTLSCRHGPFSDAAKECAPAGRSRGPEGLYLSVRTRGAYSRGHFPSERRLVRALPEMCEHLSVWGEIV